MLTSTESLFTENEALKIELESLKVSTIQAKNRIALIESENEHLREVVRGLQRNQFGKKSERYESPEQGILFNEAEALAGAPDVEDSEAESSTVDVKGHKKARGHRKPLPENLPREVVKIELPLDELKTADGSYLKVIGYEYSEKLKYEPAKISVIEYHRAKYGVAQDEYVKTAPNIVILLRSD